MQSEKCHLLPSFHPKPWGEILTRKNKDTAWHAESLAQKTTTTTKPFPYAIVTNSTVQFSKMTHQKVFDSLPTYLIRKEKVKGFVPGL